jgi:hypothetical protein
MGPAHECLEADGGSRAHVDDRLVLEEELVVPQRVLERGPQLAAPRQRLFHAPIEDAHAALAKRLGGVHGRVGVS